ncbi:hypothetical protein MMC25_003951 [Agyrium rufum]|nr:hypothetical protein [Agyrium rufum]
MPRENRRQCTSSAWDVNDGSIICAYGPYQDDDLIRLQRWKQKNTSVDTPEESELITSWDASPPNPDMPCDRIVSLKYFPDSFLACVVLEGGDITIVREQPQAGEEKIEIVGSVDEGIAAATWSPDEELLALATKAGTFLFMTRDFDPVQDIIFSPDDLKISKHVSVGWGKSETQFKGKGAKALRDPTMPEKVDEGLLSKHENDKTNISWRGDGAYVAVNSMLGSSRRVIRVYSREGVLDSVSEPVDGMEGALSWRPEGNLLASVKRSENKVEVIFFERNGLRHGQFPLRLSGEELETVGASVDLQWNVDSSVLAVGLIDRIQLWTMGNYHYYLKQEICDAGRSTDLEYSPMISWHPESALDLAICFTNTFERHRFLRYNASSFPILPNDHGVVGVIDGRILKLTPFRTANVPPPMARSELETSGNIVDVSILEDSGTKSIVYLAVLSQSELGIFCWDLTKVSNAMPVVVNSVKFGQGTDLFKDRNSEYRYARQVQFIDKNHVQVLFSRARGCELRSFEATGGRSNMTTSHPKHSLEAFVHTAFPSNGKVYLHSESTVYSLSLGKLPSQEDGSLQTMMQFPVAIQRVALARISQHQTKTYESDHKQSNGFQEKLIAFGQTPQGSLYADRRLLAKDCTSFVVTQMHLVLVTSQHLLKFVHLDEVEKMEVPPDTPETDERCRSVERGATLITVIPSIFAVVLQMPRGNVETIYPRALVLAGIRASLQRKKFKTAFMACRNHRVDMNILHDHDPPLFLANVVEFIDQVQKVEYLDLFLAQLQEKDVSKTMYKDTIPNVSSDPSTVRSEVNSLQSGNPPSSKVNRICDAFLKVFRSRHATNVQNIISAHVCKNPPDLEAGLTLIAKLQKDDPDRADRAVEHICFLSDVNRLYDRALGLYDLELTLLVAQQSQKDPREYLPYLQGLQKLDETRRRFTIDNDLGRHEKALAHLHALDSFDDFRSYMIKHELYRAALIINRYKEDNVTAITSAYADFLLKTLRFKEAGIAYEYTRDYASASEAFRLAHLWQESLSTASLIPLETSSLRSLARNLADDMFESKDYLSAASIQLDYLDDLETSLRTFCKGYFFAEAIRTATLRQKPAMIEQVIDVGLAEAMGTITELLAECKGQLNAQIPRIRELREKKAAEPLQFFEGDVNGGADIADNVSLAGTEASTAGASLFTRYTNQTGTVGTNATRRTSRNRRREERKRARGKKGSVYEEEYLVASVGRLIERVNIVGPEVDRLVVGLMRRAMRERAKAVEMAMTEVVDMCQGCLVEVFGGPASEKKFTGAPDEEGEAEVLPRPQAPIVKEFSRLSLLG